MACDYEAISRQHREDYGTKIDKIGQRLLAGLYSERTHFIFELLQNAEDALSRRAQGWTGSRTVSFDLNEDSLCVRHYGDPFNEKDVRSICAIDESTKKVTAIGRFGIGFKSVYAFTNRPEIHSGTEDFAIESFVHPIAEQRIERDTDETVISIRFKPTTASARDEIADRLNRLGPLALLFLRQIEEIRWSVEGLSSGQYRRESEDLDTNVRKVTITQTGEDATDWLVFSRPVATDDGEQAGHVEIAFSWASAEEGQLQRVTRSPLVAFFPTDIETHLSFLIQGPYRTTPSRDNVQRDDGWNRRLVDETASLLCESLLWLRDRGYLGTATLECLPIDAEKFGDDSMFAPLFDTTKAAVKSESLLPRFDSGHIRADLARIAGSGELRNLFNPGQLASLFGEEQELAWLSSDITEDRTPKLHQYLTQELSIRELNPAAIVSRLDDAFLKGQPDKWLQKLYEFLNSQRGLRWRIADMPLVRLEDGQHVAAQVEDELQAFLPSKAKTDFPTVRSSVCGTEAALEFLRWLGLKEPDIVDDVIRHVLPKYLGREIDVTDTKYADDVRRMLDAYDTDSRERQSKLVSELKRANFVRCIDAGDNSQHWNLSGKVYIATERLKELFYGVESVLFVASSHECLRGENVRTLLESCGAARSLHIERHDGPNRFSWEEKSEMRRRAGCVDSSRGEAIEDRTIRGLGNLLALLPAFDQDIRKRKAALLWEALGELEDRRGASVFSGTYSWFYLQKRTCQFPAAFVDQLNKTAWVPDANGKLYCPEFIDFDSLGWEKHPFLQSQIRFKPPVIERLEREAGFEPGVLAFLKKRGLTSMEDLLDQLGPEDASVDERETANDIQNPTSDMPHLAGSVIDALPETEAPEGAAAPAARPTEPGVAAPTGRLGTTSAPVDSPPAAARERRGREHVGPSGGAREFISYIGVHLDREEPDPDGLAHQARMDLEEQAILHIMEKESEWQRTAANNPGFDLYQVKNGQEARWCEVKAMTGSLEDRPVTLSHTQFEHAQKRGGAYWLYVVEYAGTGEARVVPIQDPAGKARYFTFDRGWLSVTDANVDAEGQNS